MVRILRVFPRITNATPFDNMCRFGEPDMFDPPDCDEVHVSVTFSWDIKRGEELRAAWADVHPCVKISGPAYNDRGETFIPGLYLKRGHVITSRGCPNHCWFCLVPHREGDLRELPITEGHTVHDSNLLACSDSHVRAVFDMLDRQPTRPLFVGGLESAILKDWHISALRELRSQRLYFAYDTPNDLEPLRDAGKRLQAAGFTRSSHLYAYVLIGYERDTQEAAERRLLDAWEAGFCPYAMLYHDKNGETQKIWRKFQRKWVRPAIIRKRVKDRNLITIPAASGVTIEEVKP